MRFLICLLIVLDFSFSLLAHANTCPEGQKMVLVDKKTGKVLSGGGSMSQSFQKECRPEPKTLTSCETFLNRGEILGNGYDPESMLCTFKKEQGVLDCCPVGMQPPDKNPSDNNNDQQAGTSEVNHEPPCSAETKQLKVQCQTEADTAKQKCDPQNGDWQGKATRTLEMASAGMRQVANSSIEMACSKMNDAMSVANAALGGFELNCNSGRSACMTTCEQANTAYKTCIDGLKTSGKSYSVPEDIISNQRECKSYQSRIDDAVASAANIGASFVMAKSCDEYTKAQEKLAGLANTNTCAQNPTAPGCEGPQNCSNPKFAAVNTVCICLSNPNDNRCSAGGGKLANGGSLLPGAGKGGVLLPGSGAAGGNMSENMGGGSLADLPMGQPGALGGEDPGGKKAGAPVGGSGSAGLGGGSEGSGRAGVTRDANGNPVLKGFYGGSGGTGGSMYGGSGSSPRAPGSEGYLRPGDKVPDLDKYRPDGLQQKLRPGMAGMVGPDGITSQHDNIFAKIKNRYNAKVMSLR